MFSKLTIAEAQEQLPNLSETIRSEPLVITQNGSPVMITFSIENFLSLLETSEILADSELMASIDIGTQQAEDNKYSDLASVKARLGF